MRVFLQLLEAMLCGLGFSMIFRVKPRFMLPSMAGAFLCWGVYLFCKEVQMGTFFSSVVSSAVVAIYAVRLARALKMPAIIVFTPSVIPLVPGSSLYYTMYFAVSQRWPLVLNMGCETMLCALGIAVGISIVYACIQMAANYRKYYL